MLLYKSWHKHWSCCSLWCCGQLFQAAQLHYTPFSSVWFLRVWLERSLIAVVARVRADLFRLHSTEWSGWAMDIQLKPLAAETSSSPEIMVWHWLCTDSVKLQSLIKATNFALHCITGSLLQKTFANFAFLPKNFLRMLQNQRIAPTSYDLFSAGHCHANLLAECECRATKARCLHAAGIVYQLRDNCNRLWYRNDNNFRPLASKVKCGQYRRSGNFRVKDNSGEKFSCY